MSNLRPAVLAAIAALGLVLVGAASASAHTVLRTDPVDQPLIGPTAITNTSSGHFTLQTQTGVVTCVNSTFTADVTSTTGIPSVAGTLTTLTAVGCTDTLPQVTITSCHLENRPVLHITADLANGGTFLITDPILRCANANTTTTTTSTTTSACYYTSPVAPGQFDNFQSELTFLNIPANPVPATPDALPAAPCGDFGNWSVTYTHVTQELTNRTLTVQPF
jgi:hypothetical protein